LLCCGTLVEDTLCLRLLTLGFCKRTGRTKRSTANRTFQACVEDTVNVLLAKRFSCGSGSLLGQDTKKFLRTFGSTFTESSLQKFFCYAYLERLGNNRGLLHQLVSHPGTCGGGELTQQSGRDDGVQRSLRGTKHHGYTGGDVPCFFVDVLERVWRVQSKRCGAEPYVGPGSGSTCSDISTVSVSGACGETLGIDLCRVISHPSGRSGLRGLLRRHFLQPTKRSTPPHHPTSTSASEHSEHVSAEFSDRFGYVSRGVAHPPNVTERLESGGVLEFGFLALGCSFFKLLLDVLVVFTDK
jgi:hypothetical protein